MLSLLTYALPLRLISALTLTTPEDIVEAVSSEGNGGSPARDPGGDPTGGPGPTACATVFQAKGVFGVSGAADKKKGTAWLI